MEMIKASTRHQRDDHFWDVGILQRACKFHVFSLEGIVKTSQMVVVLCFQCHESASVVAPAARHHQDGTGEVPVSYPLLWSFRSCRPFRQTEEESRRGLLQSARRAVTPVL